MSSFKDKHTNYRLRSGHVQHTSHTIKNKNHVFDSQGPTGKARGTSVQLVEKYLSLGREAAALGDTVMCEYFFQYAEHYRRMTQELNRRAKQAERAEAPISEPSSNDSGPSEHEKHEKQAPPVSHFEPKRSGQNGATETKTSRPSSRRQVRPEHKDVCSPTMNAAIFSALECGAVSKQSPADDTSSLPSKECP